MFFQKFFLLVSVEHNNFFKSTCSLYVDNGNELSNSHHFSGNPMVMECMKECNFLLEEATELHSNKEDLVPSDNQNKLLRPRIPFEVMKLTNLSKQRGQAKLIAVFNSNDTSWITAAYVLK